MGVLGTEWEKNVIIFGIAGKNNRWAFKHNRL